MPPARFVLYAVSLAVTGVALRGALVSPIPMTVAVALAVGYLTLILVGVFVLRLRVFVDAVVRGPSAARGVALTFDDGPDPVWTRKVLDALDASGAKATFFVIGKKAEEHADVVKEILARGHAVGLHSYAHDRLFTLRSGKRVREDLERGIAVLRDITGERPLLFRPPIGHTNPTIARVVDELDLVTVGWSVSARDGTGAATIEGTTRRVAKKLRDGAIVLLHDAAERGDREPVGPKALPSILRAIDDQRLSVVPLTTWLAVER